MTSRAVGKSVDAVDGRLREPPHEGRKPRRCQYCGWFTYSVTTCANCRYLLALDPVYREARSMTA